MRDRRGFSVAEAVIVFALIAILSTVLLVGFSTLGEGASLQRSARELALALRTAQSMTLTVSQIKNSTPVRVGIRLTTGSRDYSIFAELSTEPLACINWMEDCGETVRTYQFDRGVVVGRILRTTGDISVGSNVKRYIFFSPPEASITFFDSAGGAADAATKLTIELTAPSGRTKKVIIQDTGQVSIQ